MAKRRLILIPILILAAAFMALLSACAPTVGEVPVTAVAFEDPYVYLNTVEGNEYNTHQLYPIVYPDNASNKNVVFYFSDAYDARYVELSSSGLITAKAEKRDENNAIQPVEIVVASAENRNVKTKVFVTVENVAATEVYFAPQNVEANLASKPFKITPKLLPAHASVDTDITFTSNDPSIASVAADGTVTPVGHGTTTIVATAYGSTTAPGYLTVKIKYAPPQYKLDFDSADTHAFSQVPGSPRKISFSLTAYGNSEANSFGATLSDPSPSIEWRVGGQSVSPVPNTDAMRYDFLPEENVTTGVYYVTVSIKDADDQTLSLTSDPVSIFYPLEGITLSTSLAAGENPTVGDAITVSASHRQDQQAPSSYRWYYYKLTRFDEEQLASGGYADAYEYVNTRKGKPSALNDGQFTRVADASGASLDFRPEADGDYFFLAVPVVGSAPRYDLMKMLERTVTFEPYDGSMVTELKLTYEYSVQALLPKLTWREGRGHAEYAVEVLYPSGLKTVYYEDSFSDRFDGASFVFPETGTDFTRPFRIRVKEIDNLGWSDPVSFSPDEYRTASQRDTDVKRFYSDIEGLPFDMVLDDPRETGELLNYLRVVQPTEDLKTEAGDVAVRRVGTGRWQFSGLYAYRTERLSLISESARLETRKVIYADGSTDADGYKNCYIDYSVNKENNYSEKELEYIQTIRLSLNAFVETADMRFGLGPSHREFTGGLYTFLCEIAVDADREVNSDGISAADRKNAVIGKSDVESYKAVKGNLPNGFEFFAGREKELSVETSNELYYAAVLGLKPVPVAGSAAERVYNAAKTALSSIIGADASDREIVIAVYDYICSHVSYDHAAADENLGYSDSAFHLEGAFGVGTPDGAQLAVCDGFAKAFALMLNMMNVPCVKVIGLSGDAGHAWNKFFIEGKWYLADATWGGGIIDATKEVTSYDFLFATDADFAADHKPMGKYPATEKTDDRLYFATAGLLVASDETLAATVETVKNISDALSVGGSPVSFNIKFDTAYLLSVGKSARSVISDLAREFGLSVTCGSISGTEWRVTVKK